MGDATRPDLIEAHERQGKALVLRQAGHTYEQIAKALGYAQKSGAHAAVKEALKMCFREAAEEVRALELERLDSLWITFFPLAKAGDGDSLDRCLKIMARRAMLLGLDIHRHQITARVEAGPIREITVSDDELRESIMRFMVPLPAGDGGQGAGRGSAGTSLAIPLAGDADAGSVAG